MVKFKGEYYIVFIFEFGHNITTLKMVILYKVDFAEIEPALEYALILFGNVTDGICNVSTL